MGKARFLPPSSDSIIRMIELDSGYRPKADNFFIGIGSTAGIHHWACSLFKKGDKLGIDTPYYFFFNSDFAKSGIDFSFRNITEGTLLDRVSKSSQVGEKGYLVSPHNPSGLIIDCSDIKAVCQWGIEHPEYQLLFDEVYLKSVHSKDTHIFSAVEYADKYEKFHMVRGFSKDCGLCGFREGHMITCN